MNKQVKRDRVAAGYLIGNLPQAILHPTSKGRRDKRIYFPLHYGRVEIRTYFEFAILGTLSVPPGSLLHLSKKRLTNILEAITFWIEIDDEKHYLCILKDEIPLYVKLGILIPLDPDGMLAYQYGIL